MNAKTVIFTGSQGSGKGTQAHLLFKYFEEKHGTDTTKMIQTGSTFREIIKGTGYTNDLVRESLNQGEIQPDFLATLIVGNQFMELAGDEHLIIDGYPRTEAQSRLFDEMLRFYKREKPVFVNLLINEDDAISRLEDRKREDDSDDAIRERFNWYHKKVVPALNFFRENDYYMFLDVEGNQPIDKIHDTVVDTVFK